MAAKQILRPTSVKVGHMDFSITWVDEKEWLQKDDNDKAGSSWYSNGAIRIRMQNAGVDVHEDALRECLLHETLHCCWQVVANMAHSRSEENVDVEEWFVGSITMPLIQVLRDNPPVMKYLLAA
jgi:hypothetical protein